MARGVPEVQFAFPTPEPWQRNLLIGLFLAWVAELVLVNLEVPVRELLAWQGLDAAVAAPWQPITRFLVQGNDVFGVLIGLLVLYFALPMMSGLTDRGTMGRAFLAGAIGGSVVALGVDAAAPGLGGPLLGWGNLVVVPFVFLGLARPSATVLLLVFPVAARMVLWGSLALPLLLILATRSPGAFEMLGVWIGTVTWWHLLGPGQRYRRALKSGNRLARDVSRYQVIEGGRGQDDEWVN